MILSKDKLVRLEIMVGELVNLIMVLVGVAFVTLLERKILGYIQIRKGPNKVGFLGIIQPFSDAVRLFVKNVLFLLSGELGLYLLRPVIGLFLFFCLWIVFPIMIGGFDFMFGLLFFFCVRRCGVYVLFLYGWSSGSSYSILGSVRGVAQMVSYEISLVFIVLRRVFLSHSYDFEGIRYWQVDYWYVFVLFPLMLIWIVSCLAETNRSPFDFSEGESELVSGFNVEYGGVGFAFIFMAEYGVIILISYIRVVLFLGGLLVRLVLGRFIVVVWIWVRGALPRFRYDKLIIIAWCVYLPVSMNYLIIIYGLVVF